MKYKRCCLDAGEIRGHRDHGLGGAAEARSSREEPVDQSEGRGSLTLIVETAAGILMRRVPNSSPLPPDREQGKAAEGAIQDAAALWGLPDFTYRGQVVRVGSGVRELGDGLLVVGVPRPFMFPHA